MLDCRAAEWSEAFDQRVQAKDAESLALSLDPTHVKNRA